MYTMEIKTWTMSIHARFNGTVRSTNNWGCWSMMRFGGTGEGKLYLTMYTSFPV